MTNLETVIEQYILDHPDEGDEICCESSSLLMKAVYMTNKIPKLNDLIIDYIKTNPSELNKKRSDGRTALIRASVNSKFKSTEQTIKILIDVGADLNIQDNDGWSALMFAARYSNINSTEQTVKILIDAGANLNIQDNDGWSALMAAARCSNTDSTEQTVKMLIDAGADLNIRNNYGWPALMLATANSNTDSTDQTIRMLINSGANLNLIMPSTDNTAFDFFILYRSNYSKSDIFDMFISFDAKLNKIVDAKIIKKIQRRKKKLSYINKIIELETQNKFLNTKNKYLEAELECHPDSEFVNSVREHFNKLKI